MYIKKSIISDIDFSTPCLEIHLFGICSKNVSTLFNSGYTQITSWKRGIKPRVVFVHSINQPNATHIKLILGGKLECKYHSNFFETLYGITLKFLMRQPTNYIDNENIHYNAYRIIPSKFKNTAPLALNFIS